MTDFQSSSSNVIVFFCHVNRINTITIDYFNKQQFLRELNCEKYNFVLILINYCRVANLLRIKCFLIVLPQSLDLRLLEQA